MQIKLSLVSMLQEILRMIKKKAQNDIRDLFEEEKIDEVLEYIQTYAISVESPDEKDKSSKKHWSCMNI